MPYRFEMIGFIIESVFLLGINLIILLTWISIVSVIPIVLSSLWSLGRLKRDIDKYHNGNITQYFKDLVKRKNNG